MTVFSKEVSSISAWEDGLVSAVSNVSYWVCITEDDSA